MGTKGYEWASRIADFQPDEVILEVGSGDSTQYLVERGPVVHTIDPEPGWVPMHPNVRVHMGYAENVLMRLNDPIAFAWLDGWDYPYDGVDYPEQKAAYEARGQEYSQAASRRSHLAIAKLIATRTRWIAFDDTWRTHTWRPEGSLDGWCQAVVPPATMPAEALAMDVGLDRDVCLLEADHPHHQVPEVGWQGKGGDAIPWLLEAGFSVVEYGLGLVVLEKRNA